MHRLGEHISSFIKTVTAFALLVVASFVMGVTTASAQFSPQVDSLIAVAESAPDSIAASLNNDICWKLRSMYPEIAIQFGMKAVDVANRTGNFEQLVKGYSYIGVCHRNIGNYAEAMEYYTLGMSTAKQYNIRDQEAYGHINIGNVLNFEGKHNESARELLKAKQIGVQIGDSAILAYVCLNLGRLYIGLKDFEKAELYLHEAIDIRTKCKRLNHQRTVIYKFLADCYFESGRTQLAHREYLQCLKDEDAIYDHYLLADITYRLACLYAKNNNYDSAVYYAKRSLVFCKHSDNKSALDNVYSVLIDTYRRQNKLYDVATCYIEQVANNDSLFVKQLATKSFSLEYSAYLYKQRLQRDIIEKERVQQNESFVLLSVLLGLIVFVLIFIVRSMMQKKRLNALLSQQKDSLALINYEITESIKYAQRIQGSVVSTEDSVMEMYPDSMVYYRPKDIVSGDWYGVYKRGRYNVIVEADCTGHGVPGALLSMMGIITIKDVLNTMDVDSSDFNAAELLERMRTTVKTMLESNQNDGFSMSDGMDMSIGIIDPETRMMSFAAGNQTAFMIRDGKCTRLKGDRMPIGSYFREVPFRNFDIQLQKGDALFFMSDGIKDQPDKDNNKFLASHLEQLLLSNISLPMSEICRILDEAVQSWRGDVEQIDDMTMIGIRIE